MKKYIFTLFLIAAASGVGLRAHGQTADYLGLPGDNLNLFAVLKLFQESQTLEIFERDLNNEDTHINNLDLDQDGRIDYIRVVDNADGDYHTIVLQDALSPRDIQDVAVFSVSRDRHGRVSIQLTGDEALYGRDYIIEPNYADLDYNETPNPGYTGYNTINGETIVVNRVTTVEVAAWPLIRFMFLPTYVVWHSPWYYNYYPTYWHPWRPYYWHYYYGYHYNWDPYYYGHYRVYHYHRDNYWHDTYYSQRRSYSNVVTNRVQSGSYRKTYSHPEARKEGYDMYYKKHPDQVARRSSRPIEDPVARSNNQQRNTAGSGRRTLGESGIRKHTNETVQSGNRSRSTSTSTDSRVSTTNQKPRTMGNRSQTQTQQQTQTRSQGQSRSTEKTTTRTSGNDQKSGGSRSQSTTRSTSGSDQSGRGSSQSRHTETKSSGSERRSSDARYIRCFKEDGRKEGIRFRKTRRKTGWKKISPIRYSEIRLQCGNQLLQSGFCYF
jgi:hypothetical protein